MTNEDDHYKESHIQTPTMISRMDPTATAKGASTAQPVDYKTVRQEQLFDQMQNLQRTIQSLQYSIDVWRNQLTTIGQQIQSAYEQQNWHSGIQQLVQKKQILKQSIKNTQSQKKQIYQQQLPILRNEYKSLQDARYHVLPDQEFQAQLAAKRQQQNGITISLNQQQQNNQNTPQNQQNKQNQIVFWKTHLLYLYMKTMETQHEFYKDIFNYYDNNNDNKISKYSAFKFFKTSGLNDKTLNLIWNSSYKKK